MLTSEQKYVLYLIRKSLNYNVEEITNVEIDWDEIKRIVIGNGILLTIYPFLQEPLKSRLYNRFIMEFSQSVQQQYEGANVLSCMNENGVNCIALKGWELCNFYPHPNMRQMVDLDILFRPYKYSLIKEVLESLGYTSSPESSWMHDNFSKGAITVEAHKRLSDDSGIIQEWETQMWERAICDYGHIYKMTAEDYYIYHFIHLHKDFLGGLLGLKRIIDTWILYHQNQTDMKEVEKHLSCMGLWDFHNTIIKVCNVCFGVDNMDDSSEILLLHAFRYGLFGTDTSYKLARVVSFTKYPNMTLGTINSKVSAVFLPYRRMKAQFPVLVKYPVLLPFCWIKRIAQILRGDNKKWAFSRMKYNHLKKDDYFEMLRFFKAGGQL